MVHDKIRVWPENPIPHQGAEGRFSRARYRGRCVTQERSARTRKLFVPPCRRTPRTGARGISAAKTGSARTARPRRLSAALPPTDPRRLAFGELFEQVKRALRPLARRLSARRSFRLFRHLLQIFG